MYARRDYRFTEVASLDEKGIEEAAIKMRDLLYEFLTNSKSVSKWNRFYKSAVIPELNIYFTEQFNEIAKQISSTYEKYQQNAFKILELTYNWLMEPNNKIYELMKLKLGKNFNLEAHRHAELETMVVNFRHPKKNK
mgnify:CR=1 FL=1